MKHIKISIPFYICFIVFFLIGKFKLFIVLTSITLFHELGHILMGILFKYKIEKVIILPLGSLTIFNTKINNKLYKELLVTIMGPIFQVILLFILTKYNKYNIYLLIFNLLPIYPLDGYKILMILLYNIIPFKITNYLGLIISIILLVTLFILRPNSIIIYLIFIIYLYQIYKEYKNTPYIFNKYLFERYLYKIKYPNNKDIKGIKLNKMYKYKTHTFYNKNKIFKEEEILSKMFDNH